jgi:hypothetical protein
MKGNKDIGKMAAKRQALIVADQALPSQPVVSENGDSVQLKAWEVVLAYNLEPPFRYSQEFFWLEVLAIDQKEALATARQWSFDAPENFEATDLIRKASYHQPSIGFHSNGQPILVQWNIPVEKENQDWLLIRNPITGGKVGFLADHQGQEKYRTDQSEGYLIVLRRPVVESEPICWVPVVDRIS